MRDFSWKYFAITGDVDAYLLFKQFEMMEQTREDGDSAGSEAAPEGWARGT